jgi:hypothetical protein
MPKHRIFATTFASVYPLYVQKAERKNRTKEEIDQIIWQVRLGHRSRGKQGRTLAASSRAIAVQGKRQGEAS